MKHLIILCAPCGTGKSTVNQIFKAQGLLPDYATLDSDDINISWLDYKGTEHEDQYYTDNVKRAIELAGEKNLLLVSAGMNPINFYEKVELSSAITDTHFIAMICSNEEIRKRLKARPAERNCGSDDFIQSQIEYAAWFKKNRGKFQKFIDNTDQTPEETAQLIADFVKGI
ncbi:MAG: AAA family ATPase [Treponema sp.]|nr:AAA family ATPase [Treponema sp.]